MEMRVCKTCSEELPIEDFRPHTRKTPSGSRVYRDHSCKGCVLKQTSEYRRTRVARDPEYRERLNRGKWRSKYGEDALEVYDRMRAGETCDICDEKTAKMSVDHCHDSGQVRGLLCARCNTALGLLKEDPARIRALLGYLAEWEAKKAKNRIKGAAKND